MDTQADRILFMVQIPIGTISSDFKINNLRCFENKTVQLWQCEKETSDNRSVTDEIIS